MPKAFSLLALLLGMLNPLFAQEGYEITVSVDGYDGKFLTLANNILDKQYLVDTAYRNDAGDYVFRDDSAALPTGIYLVVTPPENNYFQVLIGEDDQTFRLSTTNDDLSRVTAEGSVDNTIFYQYLTYLNQQGKKRQQVQAMLADSALVGQERETTEAMGRQLDDEVAAYQKSVVNRYPDSFTALLIRTNQPLPPPDFEEITEEEERLQAQFRWLQRHYLDPIDLRDDRLLRTPFLINRLDYYVDKLHVQHPDSISIAIDKVLSRMDPRSELYKYYVIHFTNKAASSNIVGMDAVYVHMVDKYYSDGKAYWADDEQVKTMQDNVEEIRPLLIGRQAPDIRMKTREGKDVALSEVDAKYTILYFWAFDCGHCKKSTPVMAEFYEKWKDRDVEIFAICTKQSEIESCWEYVDDNEIGDWMHVTDRYMRFYKKYAIKSTPTIFVLDRDKTIVSKRIGADQLDGLLTALEEQASETTEGK